MARAGYWLSAAVLLVAAAGATVYAQEIPQAASTPPPSSTTVTLEQLNQCGEQTKYDTDVNDAILKAYDADANKLLAQFGGPPGQISTKYEAMSADLPRVWSYVNILMNYFDDFHMIDATSAAEYNHSSTDNKTFVRVERATIDFNPIGPNGANPAEEASPDTGSDDAADDDWFPDLVGELWWAPPDLCGYLRTAEYSVYGGNMTFTVRRRHCQWLHEAAEIQCFGPDAARLGATPLAFSASSALMASLVG